MTTPAAPSEAKLVLKSFGIKRMHLKDQPQWAVLPQGDLLIDCRGIKEHGLDRNTYSVYSKQIQEHCSETLAAMLTTITEGVKLIPQRRGVEFKKNPYEKPFVIVLFCAWGCNRSPTVKGVLAEKLKALGYDVTVEHEQFKSDSSAV